PPSPPRAPWCGAGSWRARSCCASWRPPLVRSVASRRHLSRRYLTDRSSDVSGWGMQWPMRFGIFLAPFHPNGQNPTYALERDLDLVVHLDRLGYDEAWIGEHHSAGYEIIASPELFIATVAERTKHIRLGTGV